MRVDVELVTGQHWPEAVESLLHGLPEWFGIEESVRGYIDSARTLATVAALVDGEVVGVCLVRDHTPVTSEIELLAVRRDLHRGGIGRLLVARVESDLVA